MISFIAHWVFLSIIYIYLTTQMTKKYSTAMCMGSPRLPAIIQDQRSAIHVGFVLQCHTWHRLPQKDGKHTYRWMHRCRIYIVDLADVNNSKTPKTVNNQSYKSTNQNNRISCVFSAPANVFLHLPSQQDRESCFCVPHSVHLGVVRLWYKISSDGFFKEESPPSLLSPLFSSSSFNNQYHLIS